MAPAPSKGGNRPPPGLAARALAVRLVRAALSGGRPGESPLEAAGNGDAAALEPRDRAFAKRLAGETVRRNGEIGAALARFLDRPPPRRSGGLDAIMRTGACQILFLDTPPHAAVDMAVRLAVADRDARHFKGLVNAVLRRVAEHAGDIVAATADPGRANTPDWLAERWNAAYGPEAARAIMAAHLETPPLDLSVAGSAGDAADWAARLGGRVLATGGVRLADGGEVTALEGYDEGRWWVQDAAAALPARLLGDVAGRQVADLCAAPGGKTAQLAAAGARVTSVDRATDRLDVLRANLKRLGLEAATVAADATEWTPETPADAVLLDAPCTATGTLRRHPDVAWNRRPGDLAALAELQARLLDRAVDMVRPGGLVVYAVCSLEPEEGERLVAGVAKTRGDVETVPLAPGEAGVGEAWIDGAGALRTLPCHDPGAPGGMDGFYAVRLRRRG